jgi:predicted nucleic-acid-binding protein
MVALDTNVLLRLVLNDEPTQTTRAIALVSSTLCFVPITVILEAEWVLRRVFGHSRSAVAAFFERIIGLENLEIEKVESLLAALQLTKEGVDFADALHHASSLQCTWVATFDKHYVRSTKGATPPVRHP